jgi:Cu+-exporting ATPase
LAQENDNLCHTTYRIDGMSCAACVSHIEEAIAQLPGVHSVAVNLVAGQAQVVFQAGADPREGNVERAIHGLGYAAELSESLGAGPRLDASRALFARSAFLVLGGLAIMLLPMTHAAWFHTETAFWAGWLLALGLSLGLGFVLLRRGFLALLRLAPEMDSLVGLGVLAAILGSLAEHLALGRSLHSLSLDAAPMVLGFVMLGRGLEERAKRRSASALSALVRLASVSAHRIKDQGEEKVHASDLRVGDCVALRPGEVLPCDGVVLSGASEADESLLTGEALPVPKQTGAAVWAGTLNMSGFLKVRVARAPGETQVVAMIHRLEAAQSGKPPLVRLADKAARWFVPMVVVIALATFLLHWLVGHASWSQALSYATSVLVVACPCAMGLAAPMALTTALGTAMRGGVLFKDALALEKAGRVLAVVFDKTGTLTLAKPEMSAVFCVPGLPEENALALAYALEQGSEHPLGRALCAAASLNAQPRLACENFRAHPGHGVEGSVAGQNLALGTLVFAQAMSAGPMQPWVIEAQAQAKILGASQAYLASGERILAVFLFCDTPRSEAAGVLGKMKAQGYNLYLSTGDHETSARGLVDRLQERQSAALFTEVRASQTPQSKAEWLADFEQKGIPAVMVGDGVNDAEALAKAYLGVAMGSGTDAAKASADVALNQPRLDRLLWALSLGKRTLSVIRQNFVWAFGYNLVLIPIAAGAIPGMRLPAMGAAIAMSISSLTVAINSLRLRHHPFEAS